MAHMVFVAAALASLAFGLQPAAADYYGAPWCAVIAMGDGDMQWSCEYRSVEECRPNVIAAIVAGAIRTRTSSLPIRRQNVGATTSVMLALSKRGRRSFLVIFSPSGGCGRCHPFCRALSAIGT